MSVDEMPRHRITGVVGNAIGGVAPPYFQLGECNLEGNVINVFFGKEILPPTILEPETHECPDVEGVDIPPTSDPFSFS